MTALAADRQDLAWSEGTISGPHKVAGSEVIYKGAMVCKDASGYAVPASDTAALTHVQGVAIEQVDNSSGSGGDASVRLRSGVAVHMSCAGASQAWEGRDVFAVDDQTVALAATTTNDRQAGRCVRFISATEVVVFFPLGGLGG